MVLCVVFGCSKRSGRDKDVSFYRIPKVVSGKGPEILSLSKKRREGYLKAISRVGLTEKILTNDRICSRHFHSGKPADLMDDMNPDWLPSLHLGHKKSLRAAGPVEKMRMARKIARDTKRKEQEVAQSLLLLGAATEIGSSQTDSECSLGPGGDGDLECSVNPEGSDNSMGGNVQDANAQAENLLDEIAELKKEIDCKAKIIEDLEQTVQNLTMKIRQPPFSEQTFVSDDHVKFYTGLPNITILKAVFNHVLPAVSVSDSSKLMPFQEYIAVLVRFRLNSNHQDLAYRLGVSMATISRILKKWVKAMDVRLGPLLLWPERDVLQKTMPACFQESFGKKVAVILDCFEIFVERPSNLFARACTWSSYKHHNTVKVLLGTTPQGVISYVSETWGGRVSDKHITEHCGILDKIIPGDVILADRGFDIADSVGVMRGCLHIPAFTKGKNQLSALDVHETRKIANVRIHVERVIGNVRQKYPILRSTLPIQYVTRREDECPIIDRIVRVCCALCNVCDSVVPIN